MKKEILIFFIFKAILLINCISLKFCEPTNIIEIIPEKNGKFDCKIKLKIQSLKFFNNIQIEYLIEYKNYLSKNSRLRILKNFFDLNFIRNYSIKDKISFFSSIPSDFDVVFVNVSNYTILIT